MSVVYVTGGEVAGRVLGLAAELADAGWADRPEVTSPEDAAGQVVPVLAGADREVSVALHLDRKHRLLAVDLVSVGAVANTFMSPREIFRAALLSGAAAVVVAHNHPSGDPTPSTDDRQVARRLSAAGELIGVEVLDSLVVAGDRWASLAREGVI